MKLVAGTRGSALARWQTAAALDALLARSPGLALETVVVTTRGDVDPADRLVGRLDKGFFTAELEAGLRDGSLDLAVHSLKDLPTASPEGLAVGAMLPRAAVEDWLIVRPEALAPNRAGHLPLIDGARVGSSALRREALLRRYAPTARALPLRGNVPTRVERLREGRYEAIIMAAAGVSRLGLDLSGLTVLVLDPMRWIPAPGQGAVAIQCREDHTALRTLLDEINHAPTRRAVDLERNMLRASEGGCASPFGALLQGDQLVWGLEIDGGWRRYRGEPGANPAASWADQMFHSEANRWEDEDHGPVYRPL